MTGVQTILNIQNDTVKVNVGDNVDATVTEKVDNGFKVNYQGLKGFMSRAAIRGKNPDEINVGDVLKVRVNIFDSAKQRFYVGVGEFEPKPERESKDYSKYMKSNDKMTSTLGDLLKEKDNK